MPDDTSNIVLEHLRRIRAPQERTERDMSEFTSRVSSLETVNGQVLHLLGTMSQRMDWSDGRLGRIGRRLDLVDA